MKTTITIESTARGSASKVRHHGSFCGQQCPYIIDNKERNNSFTGMKKASGETFPTVEYEFGRMILAT